VTTFRPLPEEEQPGYAPPEDQPTAPKRPITTKEMGHRGGSTTAARYGSDFYRRIGRMGALARNGPPKPIPEGRSDNRGGVKKGSGKEWQPPQAEEGQNTDG
jgi:hypothetical protein